MPLTNTSLLTDSELISELAQLAGTERKATVALIIRLAEFDARRLYEGAGFSSTFKYCIEVLRLSEDAAFNRIEAARLGRKYPAVLDMLGSGALSPTTARLVAKHLTPENREHLLAEAAGKSKHEVEKLLSAKFPQPDAEPLVRRLPMTEMTSASVAVPWPTIATEPAQSSETRIVMPRPDPRPVVRATSGERYLIRFSASAATRDKLRLAQDLLGHAVPNGDVAEVFDRALTLLVEELQRRKFGAVRRPRAAGGQGKASRNVPAEVRRAVMRRDGSCCAFVAPDGRRCGERRFLEFHHVHPYCAGGKATIENIQVRCRTHNRYEAELFFRTLYDGADFVNDDPLRRASSSPLNPFQNGCPEVTRAAT
jgi:hypothetical protein